jgi:hypothetical protein
MYRNDSHENVCFILIFALVFMYALVPFSAHFLGWRNIEWAELNLKYSLWLIIILFAIKVSKPLSMKCLGIMPEKEVRGRTIIAAFVLGIAIFYFFPWHEDRVSIGSKFAALMRAIWLYITFSLFSASELKRFLALFFTLILMLIDESRTTFILCIFFLTIGSRYRSILLPVGLIAAIILAAVRMSKSGGILYALWYGLFGEAYNGAFPVSQVAEIDFNFTQEILYLINIVLQPISFVIIKIVSLFVADANMLSAHSMLVSEVRLTLGEKLAPMGGWYLPASFVHSSFFGPLIMAPYTGVIFLFSKFLFYSKNFPYHLLFIFLAIKATPHVYINFCIYYALVFYILKRLQCVKL